MPHHSLLNRIKQVVENQTTEYILPVGGCDQTAKFIMAMIATNHFDPKIIWTTYFDRWYKSKYSYQHFHQDEWKITWSEETVLQSIEMVLSRFGYVGVELDTWEETSTSMDNPFFPNQLNHVFILVEDANNGNKETIYMVDSYTNRHFPRVRCISNWKDKIRELISSKTSKDRKNNWNHMFSVDMPDLSPRKGHLQLPVSKASASCKLQSITPKQLPKDNRELWVSIFIKGLQPNHRWCTPNIWITNNKKSSSEKLPCLKPIFVKDSVSDSAYLRCIPTASGELQVSFSGTRCRLRGSCEGSIELSLCNHADACGVCNGNGSSCMGCDGVPYSSRVIDVYGNCEAGNFSAHQTFVVKLNSLRQKRGLHLLSVNKDLQRLAEQLSLKAYVHPVDAVNSQRGYFHFLGDVIHIDSRSYASLDSLMERQGYEQLIHPVFTEIGVTADRNGFHIIMGSRHRRCGDGIVQRSAGESCDDGNTVSGDGCSSNCSTVESGWICTTTTPRHPTSKCIQLFANDTKSSKQELNTAQQLELEFLQIYLMLADDAHFHGCSYNMSNNSSSRFSTEDWKNIFRLALATAERYLFEGSHNKALLTLKSVHKLCGTDQLVPLSLQWIHNRSVLAFEDSLPDYDMNDHISMVHASSIYDGNNIFTLLHVHPLARGSAFSHKLQLVLCTTADCISNKEQEGGRKISRCSGIQSSINPPLPYLDDTTSPSFNGSKILLVKLQGNQKKAFTVDMTVLDSYQPTGITLIEDDFSAFMTAGGHPSSVPFINTLPIPMKHSSELYVSVVLIQPATAAAYRPVFRLYNVDCNSYIYADSSWSVTVPDPNWRWPLEGIPLRRMQQPGVCAGGTRSGRLCDAPVTCSFGVCKSGRCVGGTSNGRLCDSANEGSLQCPQAQSCYTAEGAYPSFPENPEWYQFPRLSDCSELWCL